MLTNKKSLSIYTPTWLTALVIVLMVARGLTFLFENFCQPKIAGIKWHEASALDLSGRSEQTKLVLYAFTTEWCEPYKRLENTSLLDKDIVKMANEQFLSVRVLEKQHPKGEEPDKLITGLQEKYHIEMFPTFLVTLPSGKEIDRRFSYVSAKSLHYFLDECQQDAKYIEGIDWLSHCKYKPAAQAFDTWLQGTSKQNKQMLDASIYSAISHQMLSEKIKAKTILEAGISNYKIVGKTTWPAPIANFLLGKVPEDALLKETDYDKYKEARAHYIIGMMKLQAQDLTAARNNLELARKNTYETSETHSLSDGQLNLLDKKSQPKK